ncbi:MAG: hypothetical protein U5L04_02690 [Trueperaceae bacterium]|nr:hypothetical protein [Trueperaceae bacterium]
MAKTDFTNGVTVVGEAFLNKIFGGGTEDSHVHDGGSEDGSASKVDPQNHIDWDGGGGANGDVAVTQDDSNEHEVTHQHTGAGASRWIADIVEAADRFVSNTIRAAAGDRIRVEEDGGGNGGFIVDALTAPNDLNVEDTSGALNGAASVIAANTPKAWAKVDESGGSYTLGNNKFISGINKVGMGIVEMTLAKPAGAGGDLCVLAHPNGNTSHDISADGTAANQITVNIITSDGSAADGSFSVVVYH